MIDEIFIGENAQDAYDKIYKKYGHNFKLKNAKQVKFKNGEMRFEITITVKNKVNKERFFSHDIHEISTEELDTNEDSMTIFNDKNLKENILELPTDPHEDDQIDENRLLKEEISKLKQEMEFFKNEVIEKEQNSSITNSVIDFFNKNGISKEWLQEMIGLATNAKIKEDAQALKEYILEEIDSHIICKEEIITSPKIILFAGPTGVGKTTTLAKIAARFGYMFTKSYSVAMINLDHYRVGAGTQMEKYAEMMGLSYRNVYNTQEFAEEIESLKGIDIILIDTAGISPFDLQRLSQTVSFITQDKETKIATTLVLPATFKLEDLQNMYDHFSFLDLESLVLTKFDETYHIGALVDFLISCPTPVSYIASGQEVPDDLDVATSEYIMEKFKESL
jgi:flagellar biosynthesis protein FlhF